MKSFVIISLILLVSAQTFASSSSLPTVTLSVDPKNIIFDAQSAPVTDVLNQFETTLKIGFKGLDLESNQTITFYYEAKSPLVFVRRLLRHLGQNNYALFYSGTRLVRVHVLPQSDGVHVYSVIDELKKEITENNLFLIAFVQIQGIIEDTQAERHGLQKGDYIVKYDNQRIHNPNELIRITQENVSRQSIELVVIRKGKEIRFLLNGGLIGVRIQTIHTTTQGLLGPSEL